MFTISSRAAAIGSKVLGRWFVPMVLLIATVCGVSAEARSVSSLNRDWKFIKQDVSGAQATGYGDGSWSKVNLPHSFDIPYWRDSLAKAPYIGWYRRILPIDASVIASKRRIFIEFEAAFQVAKVYVNGTLVGTHKGGYTGFSYDITDQVKAGDNVVAVRLDGSWNDSLAPHSGEHIFIGGIYRNVNLVITDPVHVPWYGTFVTTPLVSSSSATVKVATEIRNDAANDANCTVKSIVLDASGKEVTSFQATGTVKAGTLDTLTQTSATISSPRLWSPSSPNMYKVRTEVYNGTTLVDEFESPLGFRTVEWTKDKGFLLNGTHLWLQGANVHQDHAGWGDAIANTGSYRDVKLIKDAGMNFIRGSHYPHSSAFSDACDKLGIALWSESTFWGSMTEATGWKSGAYPTGAGVAAAFDASALSQLAEMIRIHRNHPSVIIWSMGNEQFFTRNLTGSKSLLTKMQNYAKQLDPTHPVGGGGVQKNAMDQLVDIAGYNGDGAINFIDPGRPSMVAEYGSCSPVRGGSGDNYNGCWGQLQVTNDRPTQYAWRSGAALWCAFHHGSWSSYYGTMGMIDHARIPLRRYYYYRNIYLGIAPPTWPVSGTAAKLKLTSDCDTITDDGRSDCHLVAQVQNSSGAWLTNSPNITFTDKSGLGSFPTGTSITFTGGAAEKGVMNGMAGIEFRSYNPGTITVEATSSGLTSSSVTIYVKHVSDSAPASTGIRSRLASVERADAQFKAFGGHIRIPAEWTGVAGVVDVLDLQGRRVARFESSKLPEIVPLDAMVAKGGMHIVRVGTPE